VDTNCPACFEDAPLGAFDGYNTWCAAHAARALRATTVMFRRLRMLPYHERKAACSWLADWGAVDLAAWGMRTGRVALNEEGRLPFDAELDRLSEPT
jgi:hypothetical protein